jgi:putative glutamine amidotransferase
VSARVTIGITASLETVTTGPWVEPSALVPVQYCEAVQRAGGRAVLLVPDPRDVADPAALLDLVDGVLFTGAAGDVDPARYGAGERHPETHPVAPVRDEFELALVRAAAERDMPFLGICRGMQVINVAHGGSLEQHLPDAVGHDRHAQRAGEFGRHEVRLEPGSLAARALGAERTEVHSYHHQGVREVGEGLRPTAWSQLEDGIVEAVERPDRGFALGVLWHPEEDEAGSVIGALVEAARNHRGSGPSVP